MSQASKPNPEDYDGKISQEQIDQLEVKRIKFAGALETGSADLEDFREDYQTYAIKLGIDLSGKFMPSVVVPPATEPSKPTEGVKKDGGNQDPDTWKVVHMKLPPEKFKVVDSTGKNIATDFTTQATAQGYLDYYLWQDHNKLPPPPPPGPGPTTGDRDVNGIICMKKAAAGGKVFTDFQLEEKMRNYASGAPSEWSTEYTCDTKTILQSVEVTIYEKINGFKSGVDTISLKMNGPAHKDGARFWMITEYNTDGSAKKILEIEDPHPNNHTIKTPALTSIGGSLVGKWIGYKGISVVDGNKRHVESWIHYPVENIDDIAGQQDKWRQYLSYDTTESKYLKATGSLITSRLDGVKKGDPPNYKYASVREVIP